MCIEGKAFRTGRILGDRKEMERRRGRMNGGCRAPQNCGAEKIHSDGERGRGRGSGADSQFDGRLIQFELWQHKQFGGRKRHNCPSVTAQEKRTFLFFTKKKWHLSPAQRGLGGFTSPTLFLPSSSCRLGSLTASPSCWKREGGRGVGGRGRTRRPPTPRWEPLFFGFYQPVGVRMLLVQLYVWSGASHLATASRGGRKPRHLAPASVRMVWNEPLAQREAGAGRGGEKRSSLSLAYCPVRG